MDLQLTEEECRRIARKFKAIRDFRTKAPSAYVTANRHGWLQSFTWLEREVGVKHYRTVYFDFDRPHTPTELAREALGKRYPEIAGRARMVELAAWGLSPKCRRTAHDSAI